MQAEDTGREIPMHARLIWRDHHWVTAEDLVALAGRLHHALKPWLHTHQPILLLDCAPCHLLHR
eukprot:8404407-Prorocentrum_lima.AAC.1